jgi:hypothetical protein
MNTIEKEESRGNQVIYLLSMTLTLTLTLTVTLATAFLCIYAECSHLNKNDYF